MSEKHGKKMGIDPAKIVLDDTGRFELNEEQLTLVSGGRPKTITVIRGGKCTEEGEPGPIIRGSKCGNE